MKKTFECSDTIIVTIPLGNLKDAGDGQLMPEKFHCVFKDSYKVFVRNGRPKALGAVQAVTGVFLTGLALTNMNVSVNTSTDVNKFITSIMFANVLFIVCGLLSFAAGKAPQMHVVKLSFSLNIISFFWSVAAVAVCIVQLHHLSRETQPEVMRGVVGVMMSLLISQNFISLFLIYWISRAVCRQHFTTLPIVLLKRGD